MRSFVYFSCAVAYSTFARRIRNLYIMVIVLQCLLNKRVNSTTALNVPGMPRRFRRCKISFVKYQSFTFWEESPLFIFQNALYITVVCCETLNERLLQKQNWKRLGCNYKRWVASIGGCDMKTLRVLSNHHRYSHRWVQFPVMSAIALWAHPDLATYRGSFLHLDDDVKLTWTDVALLERRSAPNQRFSGIHMTLKTTNYY
jgi:hypothetical protein